ncbi:hypothetical protein G3A56_02495 [Rhizobium oryzihabitans]|uniref:Uncharacterized protein n=1 Tax=Rhizobium oryzihabitans TaxID=2267833 RepID=A0A7L5BDU4_9HYPH|nr:hypothetical protein [Rhizobium oryzihabitans]QIB37001.1 hypothetical protein G3A56_02495 [Rhizobium oryzihabitans]
MSDIAQFPDKECMFIGRDVDETTGKEIHILEHFKDGKRYRVGEYATIMDIITAMDEICGIDRPGGAS